MKTIKNLTAEEIRKSILQLAIQGKLVKQDPSDEPASELVKRIYAEKQKLIREGKIKKDKNESFIFKGDDNCYYEKVGKSEAVKLEDLPFEIPDSWCWIRQSNLCWLDNGLTQKAGNYPYLEAKVIRNKKVDKYISSGVLIDEMVKVILVDGENSGEVMNPPFIGYMGSTFKILDFVKSINFTWLLLIFELNKNLYKNSKTGAAIPHLNKKIFKDYLIALPPIEEQKRIVDKIESFNDSLQHYEILENKLSLLESSFKEKLKASILQYAIEGKLVKQDPNDEPASVLLDIIKNEKERLIKEGKIKRDKNESTIYLCDDKNYYDNQDNLIDVPLEIPDNWLWCYLPTIASFSLGKTPERNNDKYWNNGAIPWVSISDLYDKKTINSSKEKVSVSAIIDVFKNIIVSKGTLLMSFKLTIGKTSILGMDAVHNEAIISIVPYYDKNYFIRDYLLNFLSILCQFIEQTSAIKGNTLNKEKLKRMLIPLPPEYQIYKINDTLKRLFSFIES